MHMSCITDRVASFYSHRLGKTNTVTLYLLLTQKMGDCLQLWSWLRCACSTLIASTLYEYVKP